MSDAANTSEISGLPLTGLRVIDMTSLAMGPLAGQYLGDYGADVIKVEPPTGDAFRNTLPRRSAGMGHVYLQFNRNKRSLAIDLKAHATRGLFRQLIGNADILLSNMRPAAMAGLSLDYEAVRAIRPDIIYCAAYGFSEKGPYAGRPAADDTIQAMSGIVELQGRASGQPPQLVASVVADKAAGLVLCNSVLAAVIQRMKTGLGQFIEVPMFETMASFILPEHLGGLSYEPASGPSGYSRIINPSRKPFATADGHLTVLPYTTAQWQRFFALIGREDLAADPEFKDPVRRNARVQELYAVIETVMPTRTTKAWVAELLAADILFGEVFSPEQLVEDPHLAAMKLFEIVDHPSEGRIRLMNSPVQSSVRQTQLARLPPTLGQHSREILTELGLDEAAIADLASAGHVVLGNEDGTETTTDV